jgi:hemin uptake protein HemP
MNHPAEPKTWPSAAKPLPAHPRLTRVSSSDILQGKQEVEIEHNGMLYRMRCTSLGKLILTK